jgi:outer membrane lipoprotein SlyB
MPREGRREVVASSAGGAVLGGIVGSILGGDN